MVTFLLIWGIYVLEKVLGSSGGAKISQRGDVYAFNYMLSFYVAFFKLTHCHLRVVMNVE